METEQCIEVDISLVYHIEGERLRFEDVQFVTVMPSAIGDMDVGRNAASQIQQRMHLHSTPAVFPQGPCSQLYTGGDGCGIKCIENIVNGYLRNGSLCIQRPYNADEICSQLLVYAIVPLFVGTGE